MTYKWLKHATPHEAAAAAFREAAELIYSMIVVEGLPPHSASKALIDKAEEVMELSK